MEKNLQIFRLSILIIGCIERENLLFLTMRSRLVIIFFFVSRFLEKKPVLPIFMKLSDTHVVIKPKLHVKFLI